MVHSQTSGKHKKVSGKNTATHAEFTHQHFTFTRSDQAQTGQLIVSCTDTRTGFTVRTALANAEQPVPSIMAFAGARFSRSADSAQDLFTEIHQAKESAQEKLAKIFVNYGHASVGDMAMLFAYIENVPRMLMMQFFYSSALGAGQERSSRYQDFGSSQPPKLDIFWDSDSKLTKNKQNRISKEYHRLFQKLITNYQDLKPQVEQELERVYQPKPKSKRHKGALTARAFDTVRAFLPAGTPTSGAYITSAREWARLIQQFRSSEFAELQMLGEQLQILFAPPQEVRDALGYNPEAPDLIRHTEPITTLHNVKENLDEFLGTIENEIYDTRTAASEHQLRVRPLHNSLTPANTYLYFLVNTMYPRLSVEQFGQWYSTLSAYTRKRISQVIFEPFTHHVHLPLWAHTGGYTFELKMTLSEAIDFNRHRAWGRFTTLLETQHIDDLLLDGYQLPLYLHHPELTALKNEFNQRMSEYYQELQAFAESLPEGVSPRLLASLLPNAHQIRYYLSGGPKEISYLCQLRVRPGGHINYRKMAYDLSHQAARLEPIMDALRIPVDNKPDPESREQFFDRG